MTRRDKRTRTPWNSSSPFLKTLCEGKRRGREKREGGERTGEEGRREVGGWGVGGEMVNLCTSVHVFGVCMSYCMTSGFSTGRL